MMLLATLHPIKFISTYSITSAILTPILDLLFPLGWEAHSHHSPRDGTGVSFQGAGPFGFFHIVHSSYILHGVYFFYLFFCFSFVERIGAIQKSGLQGRSCMIL